MLMLLSAFALVSKIHLLCGGNFFTSTEGKWFIHSNRISSSYIDEIKLQNWKRINQNNNLLRAAIYIFCYMIYAIAFYLFRKVFFPQLRILISWNLFCLNIEASHLGVNLNLNFDVVSGNLLLENVETEAVVEVHNLWIISWRGNSLHKLLGLCSTTVYWVDVKPRWSSAFIACWNQSSADLINPDWTFPGNHKNIVTDSSNKKFYLNY